MSWNLATPLTAEGYLLLAHPAVNFENFPSLAAQLATHLQLRICEQHWGADRHSWVLEYRGANLLLEFEELCGSTWLTVARHADMALLSELAARLD